MEAVEGPGPFCIGVQWHPERNASALTTAALRGASDAARTQSMRRA